MTTASELADLNASRTLHYGGMNARGGDYQCLASDWEQSISLTPSQFTSALTRDIPPPFHPFITTVHFDSNLIRQSPDIQNIVGQDVNKATMISVRLLQDNTSDISMVGEFNFMVAQPAGKSKLKMLSLGEALHGKSIGRAMLRNIVSVCEQLGVQKLDMRFDNSAFNITDPKQLSTIFGKHVIYAAGKQGTNGMYMLARAGATLDD